MSLQTCVIHGILLLVSAEFLTRSLGIDLISSLSEDPLIARPRKYGMFAVPVIAGVGKNAVSQNSVHIFILAIMPAVIVNVAVHLVVESEHVCWNAIRFLATDIG